MRPLTILTFFIAITCFSLSSFGQSKFESDDPVNKLLNTAFMEKFMDMRVAAESSVRGFKRQQGMYSPQQITRVQVAYDRTAEKFNFVLRGIKEDLLDKKKLKYIERYPDDYAKELELDMYKLSDFYANNYQMVLADVTGDQVDGSAVLGLIAGILDVSFNIYGLVKNIGTLVSKNKARKQYFNEQRLEKVLIKPHTWTLWHEMDEQGDSFEQPDNTAQDISTLYQDQDATYNSQIPQAQSTYAQQKLEEEIANEKLRRLKNGESIDELQGQFREEETFRQFDEDLIGVPDLDNEGFDLNGNPLPPSEESTTQEQSGDTGKVSNKTNNGAINITIPKSKKKKVKDN